MAMSRAANPKQYNRDPGADDKAKQKEAEERRKDAEFADKYLKKSGGKIKAMKKGGGTDLDKLPPSMKDKTRTGLFSHSSDVKETRKPKTKEERAGKTPEEKIKAKTAEVDRKKFEKKTQQQMGSFKRGGKIDGIAIRGKTRGRMC
jgi:hypothetical protein